MSLVESGNLIPLFDERILCEYYKVLNYQKFYFSQELIDSQISLMLNKGIFISDVKQIDVAFKDEEDIPFFEVLMDTQEIDSLLVTGNIKHFPSDSAIIVTPSLLLWNLKRMDIFIKDQNIIDESINKIIDKLIITPKYTLAANLDKDFINKIKLKTDNQLEKKLEEKT